MTVVLYSKENCPQCDATRRWLKSNEIFFREYDAVDSIARLKSLGFMSAPVVMLEARDKIIDSWSGFRPDRLIQHLKAAA